MSSQVLDDTIYNEELKKIILKENLSDNDKNYLFNFMIQSFNHNDYKELYPLLFSLFNEYKDNMGKIKTFESKIQKTDLKDMDFGLGKGLRPVNFDKYAEWVVKVPKLEQRVKELESIVEELKPEVEKLKNENLRLNIISGEAESSWIKERDLIRRPDPTTGEPDGYRCPFDFEFERVSYLDIYFSKEQNEQWCSFVHPYPTNTSSTSKFKMPHTGYLFLKGELPEQKKKSPKKSKIQKLEFKEKDDIIELLENYYIDSDKNIPGLKYLDKAIDFLWEFKDKKDKDKKFGTVDFRKNLDFCSPGTVDSYLDMFVECDIIIKIGKGTFRVNFD